MKTLAQTKTSRRLRIVHRQTGTLVAEGAIGWEITPFEGNYYIGSRALREGRFTPTFIPGVCITSFSTRGSISSYLTATENGI